MVEYVLWADVIAVDIFAKALYVFCFELFWTVRVCDADEYFRCVPMHEDSLFVVEWLYAHSLLLKVIVSLNATYANCLARSPECSQQKYKVFYTYILPWFVFTVFTLLFKDSTEESLYVDMIANTALSILSNSGVGVIIV